MTTTKVFDDHSTVDLTAQISGNTVTVQFDGTRYGAYKNKLLEPSKSVTLSIVASDGTTKLSGKYTLPDGTTKAFETNDATTISQTFDAPSTKGASTTFSFKVRTEGGAVSPDPTLILETKSGRFDENPG